MKKKLIVYVDGKRIRPAIMCDKYTVTSIEAGVSRVMLQKEVFKPSTREHPSNKYLVEIGMIHGENVVIFEK